jgi:hypothetical protein
VSALHILQLGSAKVFIAFLGALISKATKHQVTLQTDDAVDEEKCG